MKPFKFKQFTVEQDRCAMKIGTDGVLLGAWVSIKNNPFSILDIGAGTGIIALQLAQRSYAEMVDAIEIDGNAFEQCVDNFENSPWGDRLYCYHASLEEFMEEIEDKYDLIISNPPFYSPPLPAASPPIGEKKIPNSRKLARFNDALPFDELIESVSLLLSDEGIFSVIIPRKEEESFIKMASEVNLFPNRICRVRGNETSEEKRSMLEFSFEKNLIKIENLTIEISRHDYTDDYKNLVREFYLKM
ncbi:putative O-methyltransferase [Aequorivita sublithincola DSM 14238]|uniref:tRNA1(Val) (adenine(37)-N6)-methyltransferase n=1 Tax=Aequorivita sublithincola (strain DSM 14238 / LMG 21431 / ACAM 643 / 9-3) TaxID=746697 RepID=I3YVR3_AEQSU|nr:methyltransferase [Aequorivita sublithincola]AFL81081.1 putative O-methyltransferase [Aequorivita sublithincola DSM 14238]